MIPCESIIFEKKLFDEGNYDILGVMKNKIEYWTGAHTTHRLKYHLVFIPKYRKRILRGKIASHLKKLFYQACEIN